MLDVQRKPEASSAATAEAPSEAAGPAGPGFTSQGALPPVAVSGAASAAPTASEQAYDGKAGQSGLLGRLERGAVAVGQQLEVVGGEAVGVAELAGLRYPVTPYHAQVDSGLYRGSRLDDAGMAALAQMGVRGVVNLCLENDDDTKRAAKFGLRSLHVPILDNSAPTLAQMMQFIAFAQANAPTYVHCEAGKGRTGTAVACYRIAVDGWTAEQAIAEGRSYGLTLVNQISFVQRFAESIRGPDAKAAAEEPARPDGEAVPQKPVGPE